MRGHCGNESGQGKVRVSLVRFDHTEPLRTTVMKGEAGLKGSLECVRGGSKQAYKEGSSEFGAVRPYQT